MPITEFSDLLHAEKYRGKGEDFREYANRVASPLTESDTEYKAFRELLLSQRFLPGGRIQSAVGSSKNVTALNCFASGTLEDTLVHGNASIMDRLKEAAATLRMGGGIGYDFSTLRPDGAIINALASNSTGPLSFMKIFDSMCDCISSAGHRRGAQMGILRIDHPDIEAFIRAKHNTTDYLMFNLSIAVTDHFMECLIEGKPFDLTFNGSVVRTIDPQELWELIMRSTWDWAEPGVVFIDHMNTMNNLNYCETIAATNPCSEQPLPPYGACLLGSFNLTKYLTQIKMGELYDFDYEAFKADIPIVVRAMDRVTDVSKFPLYQQQEEAKNKRRMGLGLTGVANTLEALGHSYGSPSFCIVLEEIQRILTVESYRASMELAKERGSFPLFNAEAYCNSRFIQSALPMELQRDIKTYGIRNSHLTSIAPTGTISLCADNISSGIEPVFVTDHENYTITRDIFRKNGKETFTIPDYGWSQFGIKGKSYKDVTVEEHLAVLSALAPYVDSAISKTCNVPTSMPFDEFKLLYIRAWRKGLKGLSTFQPGGQRAGVLHDDEAPLQEQPETSCEINPITGVKSCE